MARLNELFTMEAPAFIVKTKNSFLRLELCAAGQGEARDEAVPAREAQKQRGADDEETEIVSADDVQCLLLAFL